VTWFYPYLLRSMISMTSKPSMAVVAYIQARAMPMSLVWVVYLREQTIPLRRKDTENSKRFMDKSPSWTEKRIAVKRGTLTASKRTGHSDPIKTSQNSLSMLAQRLCVLGLQS